MIRDDRIGRGAAIGSAAAALAALLAACGPGELGPMRAGPPPRGWAEEVAAGRTERDRRFRTDPDTPLRPQDVETFRGLSYWPVDPSYRFEGPLHLNDKPLRFTILSTSGKPRPCMKYGWVSFDLAGARHVLQVYRMLDVDASGIDALFLPFTDETTGGESYPAGRYLDLEGPEGGPYVLDFNRAYNPMCAYGSPERYACPITPKENRLAVRVEAGERGWIGAPAPRE